MEEDQKQNKTLFQSIREKQPDLEELLDNLPPDQKKIILDYMNTITSDFEANILKPLEKSIEEISK